MDNMIPGKNILIAGNSSLYMIKDELKNKNRYFFILFYKIKHNNVKICKYKIE